MKESETAENLAIAPQLRFVVAKNGCWEWTGAVASTGYAILNIDKQRKLAHRIAYQLFVGPIHHPLQTDHLCRNKKCINPAHLEAVTSKENSLRGKHPLYKIHREQICKRGHDLSVEENRIYRKDGRYRCKICVKQTRKEYQKKGAIRKDQPQSKW